MSKELGALLLLSFGIALALAVDICEYQMDGVRLAHPADCNKFVECRNGLTNRILSCPLGLHFNRFKGVCDMRQRAACELEFMDFIKEETNCSACCMHYGCYINPECPEQPGTPTIITSPTTPLTTDTPATTGITIITPSPSTPNIPDIPTTPDSSSPSTEIPSSTPTPDTPTSPLTTGILTTVDSTEPTTIHSTPATTETTNMPGTNSTAASSSLPPSSTFKPVSPETPVTPDIPKTHQCPNNLTICQKESDGTAVHVNGTCNRYIVCAAGCAYIMSCPSNLQYDIAKEQCDYPENVHCPWQTTTSITGPSGVTCAHQGQCLNQTDGKLFASPNSNGYIVCQCECEIERPCPEGTRFDVKLLTCVLMANENANNKIYESANKTASVHKPEYRDKNIPGGRGSSTSAICQRNDVTICKNQAEGALLPVNGVCNKFYECKFGCAIENLCPNNLVYNPRVEYCDYPHNYKCPWSFTPPSGALASPCGIACASGGRCVGQLDGALFPSMTSCAKYVVCQCECEVERDCAKNLYWDRNLLTCNYSANVTCELN